MQSYVRKPKLDGLLEDFVYRKIWSSLTDVEKRVIMTMPPDGKKIKIKELCSKLEMKTSSFSKYRERLMNKGVCMSPEYGVLAVALTRFQNIVRSYEMY